MWCVACRPGRVVVDAVFVRRVYIYIYKCSPRKGDTRRALREKCGVSRMEWYLQCVDFSVRFFCAGALYLYSI